MSNEQTIRAWKDEDYRLSLSEAERSALPQHPAGVIELSEPEAALVAGQNSIIPTQMLVEASLLASCFPTLCCVVTVG